MENKSIFSPHGNEGNPIMQSKNKPKPSAGERLHIAKIKLMPCIICQASPPSECHEINQGQWFTSMPLCADCHRGSLNGIHGQRRLWNVYKMDELSALNETIRLIMSEKPSRTDFKRVLSGFLAWVNTWMPQTRKAP